MAVRNLDAEETMRTKSSKSKDHHDRQETRDVRNLDTYEYKVQVRVQGPNLGESPGQKFESKVQKLTNQRELS